MNKKLQSMYKSGGLLKALLKDPAQAKMAMQMLGKQAKAADGMAVKKYRMGGQSGPPGKKPWGSGPEPANWDRMSQSEREAKYPEFYKDFNPVMSRTGNRGNVYGVDSYNADPSTAQQIAREVRSQQEGVGLPAGVGRYQAVIPSVDDIVLALQQTGRLDLSDQVGGGANAMSPMDYIKSGMQDYAGPDFHTADMVPGRSMFDAILSEAMNISQSRFDDELGKARGATRRGSNQVNRNIRGGETKEEFAERQDRAYYKPEMREYNVLDKYGDRLYESSYFGDQGFEQARGQAQADIRNAVIDMLNEASGSNVYDQYRGQTNKFL